MTDDSQPRAALLIAEATRWVDRSNYPWVVEVVFADADGGRHSIIDKAPLFWDADDEPGPHAEFPVPVYLDAVLLEHGLPGDRVRVAIDHRSVNDAGYAEFIVSASQVT
ncbi:hypothetical protein [Actinomadura viridis]|uniref:Uncharacterized protein n=1 Tax=Actinomadura viridis TaxID=58110 RepID=A0A931D9Y7_9ACTN|nr:hypothetical protein [Actinomadura viridis]MBG6086305.1 hypothetical protein [Actinomadura viridis]